MCIIAYCTVLSLLLIFSSHSVFASLSPRNIFPLHLVKSLCNVYDQYKYHLTWNSFSSSLNQSNWLLGVLRIFCKTLECPQYTVYFCLPQLTFVTTPVHFSIWHGFMNMVDNKRRMKKDLIRSISKWKKKKINKRSSFRATHELSHLYPMKKFSYHHWDKEYKTHKIHILMMILSTKS